MKNLIQDTIKKIESQHIIPKQRWKYLIKKYGLWVLSISILILGALSFSVAFNNYNDLDRDLYLFMNQKSKFVYFLSLLPYFWIVLIGIFLTIAFWEIRKTETGYRYSWLKMMLITIGGIVIFGILSSLFGVGGSLNSKLTKDVPFYGKHIVVTKESQWTQPDKGFIAGKIISLSKNELEIRDLRGKKWNIIIDNKTRVAPSVNLSREEMIKIIGKMIADDNFGAQEIRPWKGPGKGANHRTNNNSYPEGRMLMQ